MSCENSLDTIIIDLLSGLEIIHEFFNQLEIPLFPNEPFIFILHDNNNKIVKINKFARKILGNVEGLSSWSIYAGSLIGISDCPSKRVIEKRKKIKIKDELIGKDGTIYKVLVIAIPLVIDGDIRYVAEFCLDLGVVSNIKQKILSSELKFQQLFNEVPCYIFVFDKKYKIISANSRFNTEIGNKKGDNCYTVYGNDSICRGCLLNEALESGIPKNFEGKIKDKKGEDRDVLIWLSPIRDSQGNINSIMEMIVDITDVKKMQKYLANLGFFLSSVSHEIKNMFTAIDGYIYKINKGINSKDLNIIQENMLHLDNVLFRIKRMVVDILDYAKQKQLNLKKVSINFILNYINEVIIPKFEKYDVDFKIFSPKKDFHLYLDEQKFMSALINILDNAIDACIMDNTKKYHQVKLIVTRKKNKAIFKVIDNGVGISKERLSEIFEPFYSSKKDKGTGLGLFITKEIIEKHGGKIFVKSDKNRGTEFMIEIPVYYLTSS